MMKRADQALRNTRERERCAIDPAYRAARRSVYRRWAEANPEKAKRKQRRFQLKEKYGLSLEEYEQMIAARDGRCDICACQVDRLVVDHDHVTNMVRGLLCSECNLGLGKFRDSIPRLHYAANYLHKHSAVPVLDMQ